jgi:hypothetical protein
VPVLILGRHVAGVASEAWALIVPRRLPDLAAHPLTP